MVHAQSLVCANLSSCCSEKPGSGPLAPKAPRTAKAKRADPDPDASYTDGDPEDRNQSPDLYGIDPSDVEIGASRRRAVEGQPLNLSMNFAVPAAKRLKAADKGKGKEKDDSDAVELPEGKFLSARRALRSPADRLIFFTQTASRASSTPRLSTMTATTTARARSLLVGRSGPPTSRRRAPNLCSSAGRALLLPRPSRRSRT